MKEPTKFDHATARELVLTGILYKRRGIVVSADCQVPGRLRVVSPIHQTDKQGRVYLEDQDLPTFRHVEWSHLQEGLRRKEELFHRLVRSKLDGDDETEREEIVSEYEDREHMYDMLPKSKGPDALDIDKLSFENEDDFDEFDF